MGALIEIARDNITRGRNLRGEEMPAYQRHADQAFMEMRGECEDLLKHHGQTSSLSRWWLLHPWMLMAALVDRVNPVEILESRRLSLVEGAEPSVTITLSHSGRVASRSWFIEVAIQGLPEILRLYRDGGKVFDPSGSGHPLRRANTSDARNYGEVVELFAARFVGIPTRA